MVRVNSRHSTCVTYAELYAWIQGHVAYYSVGSGWKPSVRHELSKCKYFTRHDGVWSIADKFRGACNTIAAATRHVLARADSPVSVEPATPPRSPVMLAGMTPLMDHVTSSWGAVWPVTPVPARAALFGTPGTPALAWSPLMSPWQQPL